MKNSKKKNVETAVLRSILRVARNFKRQITEERVETNLRNIERVL